MTTAARVVWPFVGRHAELERIGGAVADDRVKAVLITGKPGVGKTRLAEEGLRVARARHRPTAYVSASGIAATVPLSALAPILPPHVERHDPYALFATVRDHLAHAHGGERLVLAVDDVQLLDATSEALLAFLLAEDAVFVIAASGPARRRPSRWTPCGGPAGRCGWTWPSSTGAGWTRCCTSHWPARSPRRPPRRCGTTTGATCCTCGS